MTSITFSLIRKQHPHLNADNLDQIEVINLSGLGIVEIDNLEIFAHIRELNLSNNNITRIENIDFMVKLETLDLSNNEVTSENLSSCLATAIPSSLKFINLTGNPCSDDENALGSFNDMFPNLNIILGVEESEDESDGGDNDAAGSSGNNINSSEIEGKDNNNNESESLLNYKPLDSEAVLKLIVERKCKPQKDMRDLEFDLQNCIKELNVESEKAINKIPTLRKSKVSSDDEITHIFKASQQFSDESSLETKRRVDELIRLSRENRSESLSFMDKLREQSLKKLEQRRNGDASMPSARDAVV